MSREGTACLSTFLRRALTRRRIQRPRPETEAPSASRTIVLLPEPRVEDTAIDIVYNTVTVVLTAYWLGPSFDPGCGSLTTIEKRNT